MTTTKAICSNDHWETLFVPEDMPRPHFGDMCEIVGMVNKYGEVFYVLKYYPTDIHYHSKHFQILPQ